MNTNEQVPTNMNGLEQFSEEAAVNRLTELGVRNVEAAFQITGENDIDGRAIEGADIFWVKYGVPEEAYGTEGMLSVEGKLYLPKENANGEVIVFSPGFPGGNAGRFEQRYVSAFIEAGYAFATTRHNGASLTNGATSLEILNSAKRMEIAAASGEHHLGGTREQGYAPSEMINEPINVLGALHQKFDRVHLMGQSMGVSSSYNSLTWATEHPEISDKIGNIVGISGYVGDTSETPDGIWSGMKKDFNKLAEYEFGYMEKVDLNAPRDAKWYADEMKKVAAANESMKVPPNVGNILIYTPEDPLIAGPDKSKEDYALNYGPKSQRKLIIEDHTKPVSDKKPHSMLWIEPSVLVRALKMEVSAQGPHFVRLPVEDRTFTGRKGEVKQGKSIVQKG